MAQQFKSDLDKHSLAYVNEVILRDRESRIIGGGNTNDFDIEYISKSGVKRKMEVKCRNYPHWKFQDTGTWVDVKKYNDIQNLYHKNGEYGDLLIMFTDGYIVYSFERLKQLYETELPKTFRVQLEKYYDEDKEKRELVWHHILELPIVEKWFTRYENEGIRFDEYVRRGK